MLFYLIFFYIKLLAYKMPLSQASHHEFTFLQQTLFCSFTFTASCSLLPCLLLPSVVLFRSFSISHFSFLPCPFLLLDLISSSSSSWQSVYKLQLALYIPVDSSIITLVASLNLHSGRQDGNPPSLPPLLPFPISP